MQHVKHVNSYSVNHRYRAEDCRVNWQIARTDDFIRKADAVLAEKEKEIMEI